MPSCVVRPVRHSQLLFRVSAGLSRLIRAHEATTSTITTITSTLLSRATMSTNPVTIEASAKHTATVSILLPVYQDNLDLVLWLPDNIPPWLRRHRSWLGLDHRPDKAGVRQMHLSDGVSDPL